MPLDQIKDGRPDRITLRGYPSCHACLSWSVEGLAVALGGHIQVLKPTSSNREGRNDIQKIPKWVTTTLRVDQFSQKEWPEQPLAPTRSVSIAEEQSDAAVIALAWSPQGLGIHRRAGLAVLTSNLVLSIWETDGSQNGWQRGFVVNNHLSVNRRETDDIDTQSRRRRIRIRSFCWLDPLKRDDRDLWGTYFLLVVDDQSRLTCLGLSKTSRQVHGHWKIISQCSVSIPFSDLDENEAADFSRLHRAILTEAPIQHLEAGDWTLHGNDTADGLSRNIYSASIACSQSRDAKGYVAVLQVSDQGPGNEFLCTLSLEEHTESTTSLPSITNLREKPEWRNAIDPVYTEFAKVNLLGDRVRICYWGLTCAPAGDLEATCFTLHPQETFEHAKGGQEKTYVVFRRTGMDAMQTSTVFGSQRPVPARVLDFVMNSLRDDALELQFNEDGLMLSLLKKWATEDASLPEHCRFVEEVLANSNSRLGSGQSAQPFSTSETCSICDEPIPFVSDLQNSICTSGHAFTRCHLTLISIQEPGISKYCADCNRQFLDMAKHVPHGAQSLIRKVFDEFDACPYCSGRYRS